MLKKITLIVKTKKMMRIKKTTKQQYRVKTTKCLSLFKKFRSRSKDLMDEIEDANGDIDDGQLLLLVVMRKNFTLTLLIKY